MNQYSDGSGSWTEIYPFTSLEAAKSRLQEIINEWGSITNSYYYDGLIKAGVSYDLELPAELVQKAAHASTAAASAVIDSKQKELYQAKASLAKVAEKWDTIAKLRNREGLAA